MKFVSTLDESVTVCSAMKITSTTATKHYTAHWQYEVVEIKPAQNCASLESKCGF